MITVTLIGADGSGKSTLGKKICEALQFPSILIYMGENPEAATHTLLTTRIWGKYKLSSKNSNLGGPPDPVKKPLPKKPIMRILKEFVSALRYTNIFFEEWYRQCVVWYYRLRHYIVITDRHFYLDYYHSHISPGEFDLPLAARVHGMMLARFYPKPDLILFLDAPPEVLFARKGEGNFELLESRRQEYIRLSRVVESFHTLDASQPIEIVAQQATNLILDYLRNKK